MQAYAVLTLLPMLAYCLVQTFRDLRRRQWVFATWGGATALFLCWIIEALTRGSSYRFRSAFAFTDQKSRRSAFHQLQTLHAR